MSRLARSLALAGLAATVALLLAAPIAAHDPSGGHDMSTMDMPGMDMSSTTTTGHDMSGMEDMPGMDMSGSGSAGHDMSTMGTAHDHGAMTGGHDHGKVMATPPLRTRGVVLLGFVALNAALMCGAAVAGARNPGRTRRLA